ncbi:NADPH-dependent 1-acyldihydroxyacetone phosphate reductase [Tetrabaena socialis]|uniref:NADPH-dependent 1-acyldihydroxyacetone phosphate reductase n=1 Tax=Tetrabaena socialis TaxID=47790 RepID=A0A2J8AK52_9CHLO|nr:NADPH-dependent 1-acyldihydroxyacetone phosphate reductase [Tetrabaena socialis]|eukprot:PNH12891.1 NADPH-dependent 1-acyldihydroxyacetone phosphate reductase [Tetrabaena socialis]
MASTPSCGPVVLVTGCSDGGIGSALCEAFHDAGCTVYATARRPESMARLQGAGIRKLQLDVASPASIAAAVGAVLAEAGRIDILVNNAGMGLVAPLVEVDLKKAREVFEANYWGTLQMVQAVAPHMAARRSGTICNVGSVVGYISSLWGAIYSSSKAAVHSLTDALRLELRPFNVKVVLLAPGAVQSNIGANNLQRFDAAFNLYAPFADVIRERTVISQGKNSMPTDLFARRVVKQLLRPAPPRHFMLGGFVWLTRMAMWWPLWLRDRMLANAFKLNRLLPPPEATQPGQQGKKARIGIVPRPTIHASALLAPSHAVAFKRQLPSGLETAPTAKSRPSTFTSAGACRLAMTTTPSCGPVVLVTGCSDGGIGSALCEAFHGAGCVVYATARRPESMARLQGAGIRKLPLDVASPASIAAAVGAVLAEAGRIDILVNNAGMGLVAPLVEMNLNKAREVFEANYWGTLQMVQAVAPHMAARRSGTICNVGSTAGFLSMPWGAVYSSSKAAVHSLTDALRLELQPFSIKVMLLAPGVVASRLEDKVREVGSYPGCRPSAYLPIPRQRFADDELQLYAPFAAGLRAVFERPSRGKYAMPADLFARRVVKQLLRPTPPRQLLLGAFVQLLLLVLWWPLWLRDRVLAKAFKLDRPLPIPCGTACGQRVV